MNIRRATIEDLGKLQKLDRRLFDKEIADFDKTLNNNWPFSDEGKGRFVNRITKDDGVIFVAEDSGEIIGYFCGGMIELQSWRKPEKIAELESVYILDEYRSQGIGTKLMAEFLSWCKDRGVERIKIEASAKNEPAIRFYNRHGFEPYDIILEKEL